MLFPLLPLLPLLLFLDVCDHAAMQKKNMEMKVKNMMKTATMRKQNCCLLLFVAVAVATAAAVAIAVAAVTN